MAAELDSSARILGSAQTPCLQRETEAIASQRVMAVQTVTKKAVAEGTINQSRMAKTILVATGRTLPLIGSKRSVQLLAAIGQNLNRSRTGSTEA